MRNIIVSEFITLDGVFEDPGGSEKTKYGGWSFDFWNEEAMQYKHDELFASGALLLGRVTYEGFAAAWPTMEGTGDFGERMNNLPKYVVSSSLKEATWNNSQIIKNNPAEEILKLKKETGEDILVSGSGELADFLLKNNLIDEIRLMVHPVVLGSGKRFFKDTGKISFQLIDTKKFSSGIIVLHYKPLSA